MNFVSPLRYPGGKTALYDFFSNLIEENSLKGIEYSEPFAGGAGLALKLLVNGFVSKINLNDLDRAMYSFWYILLEHPEDFISWLKSVEINIENWNYYKTMQTKSNSIFELGISTFYLNRTNVSGVIKAGPIGGKKQESQYKIDSRFNKVELLKKIDLIHKFKNNINIYNLDGKDFLNNLDQKSHIFYIDPPYVEKASGLYMNFFKEQQHIELEKNIQQLESYWVTSYDTSPLISKIYKKHLGIQYELAHSTSNKIGSEYIFLSKNLKNYQSYEKLKNSILV